MRKCLVAVCHNWPVVYSLSTQSLLELGWGDRVQRAKDAHGFDAIDWAWFAQSPRVDALRDMAAEQALGDGYTHILYLDADMAWPSDTLLRMLAHHDKGIVSGLYFQKGPPYFPIALRDGVPQDGITVYQHDQHYRDAGTGLRPQEVVGMGCTLVPTAVFGAIGSRPWFHYEDDAEGWPRISEDVPFCRKATEAGFAVWLDPSVKCLHGHVDATDERHWLRYRKSMDATAARQGTVTAKVG